MAASCLIVDVTGMTRSVSVCQTVFLLVALVSIPVVALSVGNNDKLPQSSPQKHSSTKLKTPFQVKLDQAIEPYLQNGSILVATHEEILYGRHIGRLFVPGSILKLATALAAFHYLGDDYRFKTEIYLSPRNDVIVRGYGDPFLVSEEWQVLATQLHRFGNLPKSLRNLYLDDSVFHPNLVVPGVEYSLNPYDARNGALISNFNTIYVDIHSDGSVVTAEEQTPLTPLARRLSKNLKPGKQRINISPKPQYILPYSGQLFREFLSRKGYVVTGKIERRIRTSEDRLVYEHSNQRPLTETVQGMMKYSNNFIANQLLLTGGWERKGAPATLEKGTRLLERFLTDRLKIDPQAFVVAEGSGISRDNRMTARAMLPILKAFAPRKELLNHRDGAWVKTGTLRGVYTLAGYLPYQEETLYFVIMLNQPNNHRERILKIVKQAFGY